MDPKSFGQMLSTVREGGEILRGEKPPARKLAVGLVPAKPGKKKLRLGAMKGKMEIVGDIVGPIGAFDPWEISDK